MAVDNKFTILLIDDDAKFCRLISSYLSGFGYVVSTAHNGAEGLQMALTGNWSAVVLDVMLPGMDGLEVLRRLRAKCTVPVLMLTALGSEPDRIVGLELGADDYLPKTSSPRELIARLRALLRRASYTVSMSQESAEDLVIGTLLINSAARLCVLADEPLSLTPVEFDLLMVLAQSRGRVKSREELINEIRDRNYEVVDRSIDVHISALRRKLGDDPKNPRFIRTVRGAGYMMPQRPEA